MLLQLHCLPLKNLHACNVQCASNRPLVQAAKQATQEYRNTWKQDKKTEPEEATGESGQPPSTDAPISEDLGANAWWPSLCTDVQNRCRYHHARSANSFYAQL